MNGLLAIQRYGIRSTIIVINNDGGGIFERLPISKFEPPFTELFTAPHGLTFEHTAKLYGIDHVCVERLDLKSTLENSLVSDKSTIIEIPSDAKKFESLRKELQQKIRGTTFMSQPPTPDTNFELPNRTATFMSQAAISDMNVRLPNRVYYRRNFPHLHPDGFPFFITFRLVDSLPMNVLGELKQQLEFELQQLGNNSPIERDKIAKKHFGRYDDWLDRCKSGPRWLEQQGLACIIADKIQALSVERYQVLAYCIMPNHVHLLIIPIHMEKAEHHGKSAAYPLTEILRLLKGSTARECNLKLKRTGHFWQQESYDRYVRNEKELERIIHYIITNPVKAGLVKDWKDHPFTYVNPELGEW